MCLTKNKVRKQGQAVFITILHAALVVRYTTLKNDPGACCTFLIWNLSSHPKFLLMRR